MALSDRLEMVLDDVTSAALISFCLSIYDHSYDVVTGS